jgi:hypothetical protein
MINDILTARSRPSQRRPGQHPQLYNSHLTTIGQATPVRYAIDDELWESFTVEQVNKQIGLLRETGRFRPPNNGDPFVVRVSQYALMGDPASIAQRDILVKQGHPNVSRIEDAQCFYDFSFDGDTLTTTVVTRHRLPGSLNWKMQRREDYERAVAKTLWKEAVIRIWWEKDYGCTRCQVPQDECEEHSEIAWMAANVVVILLQDRTANKIEIEPKRSKTLNLNFIKRRPKLPGSENAHEIVLTIPRRVYSKTSGNGKAHASPRLHYRAEHVRRQPYGPRSAPSYRETVIPGQWINADDISPAERGTPITRRYYRFEALRQKEKLHTS